MYLFKCNNPLLVIQLLFSILINWFLLIAIFDKSLILYAIVWRWESLNKHPSILIILSLQNLIIWYFKDYMQFIQLVINLRRHALNYYIVTYI